MHAVDNFSLCSIEGQLSLEPTIMDKFLWNTHSSTLFSDFTEAQKQNKKNCKKGCCESPILLMVQR